MRITPRQYAESLYASLRDASEPDRAGIIDRFLSIVSKDRRRRDIPIILRHIDRIAERETGEKQIDIVSADLASEQTLERLMAVGRKAFGGKNVQLRRLRTNTALLGGAIFRTENETFDASISGRLGQLKQFLERSL